MYYTGLKTRNQKICEKLKNDLVCGKILKICKRKIKKETTTVYSNNYFNEM